MYHNFVTIVIHLQYIIIFALINQLSFKEMHSLNLLCFTCVFLIPLCLCRFFFFFHPVRFLYHYWYWKIWSEFFSFLYAYKSTYLPWCLKIFLLSLEVHINFFFLSELWQYWLHGFCYDLYFCSTICVASLSLVGSLYGFPLDFKWFDYNGPCCCILWIRFEMFSHSLCVEDLVPRTVFRGAASGAWLDHD